MSSTKQELTHLTIYGPVDTYQNPYDETRRNMQPKRQFQHHLNKISGS